MTEKSGGISPSPGRRNAPGCSNANSLCPEFFTGANLNALHQKNIDIRRELTYIPAAGKSLMCKQKMRRKCCLPGSRNMSKNKYFLLNDSETGYFSNVPLIRQPYGKDQEKRTDNA